jgi:hypothetical protein
MLMLNLCLFVECDMIIERCSPYSPDAKGIFNLFLVLFSFHQEHKTLLLGYSLILFFYCECLTTFALLHERQKHTHLISL